MVDYIPTTSTPSTETAYGGCFGNLFTVPANVSVSTYQYYQRDLTKAKPTALRLFRVSDGALLDAVTSVTSPTATGWQTQAMSAAVNLVTGTQYIVAVYRPNTSNMQGWATSPPAVGSAFSHVGVRFGTSTTAPPSAASSWELCDAGLLSGAVGPLPPDPPPDEEPDPGTLDPGGTFPYWLHQDTTNPDSLPKLTYEYLIAYAESTGIQWDNINAILGTASSSTAGTPPTAMGRLGLILVLLEALPGIASNVADLWGKLFPGTTTLEDLAALIATLEGNVSSNIGRDQIAIPGSGWLLREQTAGAGASTWDEPADRYVFTITNPEVLSPGMVIDGVPYFTHRGWWAPLNIDLVGNHRTFVGNKSEWYEVGHRLPGAIWYVEPEISWTLQAYDYSPGA